MVDSPGQDLMLGGNGDDESIRLTNDGSVDYANCGAGSDRVLRSERGDGANVNCEQR